MSSFSRYSNAASPDAFLASVTAGASGVKDVAAGAGEIPTLAAPVASQAAQMVREIHEIADKVASIERNSVEVKFHFGENERLSVRVEYRDGAVQATFHTNSTALREALAREWQTQAVAASEPRQYRLADPIFVSPAANASASQGFSAGGDASRQQQAFAEQGGAAVAKPSWFFNARNNGSAPASAPAVPAGRPETALHLHTFA
jgi:hypothetical protein